MGRLSMNMGREAFIKAVKNEFADLIEDLDHVETRCKEEFDRLDISQYVYRENRAFLEKERDCVSMLLGEIEAMDPAAYPDGRAMREGAMDIVRRHIQEMEYPKAIETLVERKLAKALGRA
jgi:hypothetical protein